MNQNPQSIVGAPVNSEAFSKNTAPLNRPLTSGRGARVWDVDGREYLDFCSQTLNANLGHSHPVVLKAVAEQLGKLTCASSRFSSDVAVSLHQKLVEITPPPLRKVNLASLSGSLANECAVKASRKKTGRRIVISRQDSHLGQSLETMRISGKHWSCDYVRQRDARFLPPPNCYRCPFGMKPDTCSAECLDSLEEIAAAEGDNICAVMMEPIMVDAGVLAPPPKYHQRVQAFCKDHHVPLIWDEIQTAFGWLGVMFAMNVYNIVPDIVTLGKGLAAGLPLAATIFTPEFDVLNYGEHEITAGSHPLSCAASLAMICHLQTSDELTQAARKAELLRTLLEAVRLKHRCIGDIRGVGLLLGVEFVDEATGAPDPEKTYQVFRLLLEGGVITRISKVGRNNNVLQLKPPLVIKEEEVQEVADKLDRALLTLRR